MWREAPADRHTLAASPTPSDFSSRQAPADGELVDIALRDQENFESPKTYSSRANLEKAERRLEDAEADRARENETFDEEKVALSKQEDAARRAFDAKRSKLDAARLAQANEYDEALKKWRAS